MFSSDPYTNVSSGPRAWKCNHSFTCLLAVRFGSRKIKTTSLPPPPSPFCFVFVLTSKGGCCSLELYNLHSLICNLWTEVLYSSGLSLFLPFLEIILFCYKNDLSCKCHKSSPQSRPTVLGEGSFLGKILSAFKILCFALFLLYSSAIHVHMSVWEADGFSKPDLIK